MSDEFEVEGQAVRPNPVSVVFESGDFRVEEMTDWDSLYRLVHIPSGLKTGWTSYSQHMMLEVPGASGEDQAFVCLCPVYTDLDNFAIMSPVEAFRYMAVLEDKA